MILARRPVRLFGGEGEGFAAVGDHLAHLADAFRALGFALITLENFARTGRAGFDRERHVALSQTVTVAHVQERVAPKRRLRLVRYSRKTGDCNAFAVRAVDAVARASHLRRMSVSACQIYLITPPVLDDLDAFASQLEAALDAGPVAALQIRIKPATDEAITAVVRRLAPVAQSRDVAVILNDRPDLAAALGCDGVHVGQDDASVASARRIMGKSAMIGATCHDSRHLGMEAAEQGADYVAFGAFYPTTTKETVHRPTPDILTIWQETMEIPSVAIGGITVDNAAPLVAAGADFLAVSAGVWGHPSGVASAVRQFSAILAGED